MPTVTVVGNAPLPGIGIALKDMPANVQTWNTTDLVRQPPADPTQFLDRNANSVSLNSTQGNANQQDLMFRGFAASPLLGTPQGISVFQDGVRINEPFGDTVNWDLLPRSAISSIQLIPGSNPVFGLNTLGGTLAIHTRSGAQHPGGGIEASTGSFGRHAAEFDYGGSRGKFDWFATANAADDDGWAEHNPSRIRQFFGKIGLQDERFDLDASLTLANNTLLGTQTLPVAFLDRRREAYTYPDINENRLTFLALKGSAFHGETTLLSGNLYVRSFRNGNLSSNVNGQYGMPDPDTGSVQRNEANNIHSVLSQRSAGGTVQLTLGSPIGGLGNSLVVGASVDSGSISFTQQEVAANFTPDRGTTPVGEYAPTLDVDAATRYLGTYLADTLKLNEQFTLTLSGRANHARIRIRDRSGTAPGGLVGQDRDRDEQEATVQRSNIARRATAAAVKGPGQMVSGPGIVNTGMPWTAGWRGVAVARDTPAVLSPMTSTPGGWRSRASRPTRPPVPRLVMPAARRTASIMLPGPAVHPRGSHASASAAGPGGGNVISNASARSGTPRSAAVARRAARMPGKSVGKSRRATRTPDRSSNASVVPAPYRVPSTRSGCNANTASAEARTTGSFAARLATNDKAGSRASADNAATFSGASSTSH